MKKLPLFFYVALIAFHTDSFAQFSRYVIQLKDKNGSSFSTSNPSQFLTRRAIDRRTRYNISIDETDVPVTPAYIDSIRLSGTVTILSVSKWFNQVCIQTSDNGALNKINAFSFVKNTSPVAARFLSLHRDKQPDSVAAAIPADVTSRPQSPAGFYNYGVAYPQVHLHNAEFLHNHGFRGEGMQMAIMDAGFYHYQSLPTFDSIRNNNQVLETWDFVAGNASVNEDFAHGMNCLSTIAANMPGVFVGTAPKTSFYLYRTEDISSEYPVEEHNWVSAAERADSLGADVFSVSLGYSTFDNPIFNYNYANMDGNTTTIARAADLAAKKGILMVAAAGNEGASNWHYVTTPADADSVLAVGAVDTSRQVAGFSSYGPSSDGQVKPTVAAVGVRAVIADANSGNPAYGSGTSFACPIMAGITTCLWQAFPEVSNMQIIDALGRSADKFTTPNDRTGYGVPDVKNAFVMLIKKLYAQQITPGSNCDIKLQLDIKTAADMFVDIERKLPGETSYTTLSTLKTSNIDFTKKTFSYTDDLSAIKNSLAIEYRFKMTIASDTSFYLDSASVNYTPNCNTVNLIEKISINPNPAVENIFISVTRNTAVNTSIELYNGSGQKVYSLVKQPVSGTKIFSIPVKQLSRGVYFVTVLINDKKVITKKVIVP
ncbi:MAG: family serine peptidase [Ferruginibacter sp.]|uniref:S8 family serine peptidase n=1 Tax=Ferruginibacter sp. TaxID=1940288 RepID=UPI0026596326|nr:S8 family serine peptidase [Ferruginibacter sp.]MDB5278494.1 family serine peptidase [Ferruginibacter sp.]